MKAVLVMEMPENCLECPLLNGSDECVMQDEDANMDADTQEKEKEKEKDREVNVYRLIEDVDSEYNADLVVSRLISEVHNGNSRLRKYLNDIGISSDAFADILELGLDAVKTRELWFRRLRNHHVMCGDADE